MLCLSACASVTIYAISFHCLVHNQKAYMGTSLHWPWTLINHNCACAVDSHKRTDKNQAWCQNIHKPADYVCSSLCVPAGKQLHCFSLHELGQVQGNASATACRTCSSFETALKCKMKSRNEATVTMSINEICMCSRLWHAQTKQCNISYEDGTKGPGELKDYISHKRLCKSAAGIELWQNICAAVP